MTTSTQTDAVERAALAEAFEQCRELIQEAKGHDGPNGGYVTDHLDFAEHWLMKAEALAATFPVKADEEERLREAVQGLLDRMSGTYKARNGREMGIQGDDGEKCWIVHSDDITALEDALSSTIPEPGDVTEGNPA